MHSSSNLFLIILCMFILSILGCLSSNQVESKGNENITIAPNTEIQTPVAETPKTTVEEIIQPDVKIVKPSFVDGNLSLNIAYGIDSLDLLNEDLNVDNFGYYCVEEYCVIYYTPENFQKVTGVSLEFEEFTPLFYKIHDTNDSQILAIVATKNKTFEYCSFNFVEEEREVFTRLQKPFEGICPMLQKLEDLTGLNLREKYLVDFQQDGEFEGENTVATYSPLTGIVSINQDETYFLRSTILHELVHSMTEGMNIPRWFDEGLAEFYSWKAQGITHVVYDYMVKSEKYDDDGDGKIDSFNKMIRDWEYDSGESYLAYGTAEKMISKLYGVLKEKKFKMLLADRRLYENNFETEKEKTAVVIEVINTYLPDEKIEELQDIFSI